MKAKTIKSVIQRKINELIESVDSEEIKSIFEKKTVVTGGCIASMLLCEKVNDFDLYFKDQESALAVARYYVNKFIAQNPNNDITPIVQVDNETNRVRIHIQSAGVVGEEAGDEDYQYFESTDGEEANEYIEKHFAKTEETESDLEEKKGKYRPVFLSENAITLSNNVQLVIRFFGDPKEIHESYDFVHCMNYYTSWDKGLTLNPKALESLLTKELIYNGSLYPLCSIIRTRKFIKRGWNIGAGSYLKMALQLNDMDLNDPKVLREQITGVDMAYFAEVLELAQKRIDEGKPLDSAYLVEIIDRMMG